MKKRYASRHTRSIALPKKLDKALQIQANKEDLSVSSLVRKIIVSYLVKKQ